MEVVKLTERQEWTVEELEDLAFSAYQKKPLRCPRCSARVRAQEMGYLGRNTIPLHIECERCGTAGEYSPDHLEEMELAWSREDQVRILERYWAAGVVRCTVDGAVLKVLKSEEVQPPPPELDFLCPQCGRNLNSRHVEEYRDPDS